MRNKIYDERYNPDFMFRVECFELGWCDIVMFANGRKIELSASELGDEPLSNLVECCDDFQNGAHRYFMKLTDEHNYLNFSMYRCDDDTVVLYISMEADERKDCFTERVEIPLSKLVDNVKREAAKIFRAFTIEKYLEEWDECNTTFPREALIRLLGGNQDATDDEIKHLAEKAMPKAVQDLNMKECTVYFDAALLNELRWQLSEGEEDIYFHINIPTVQTFCFPPDFQVVDEVDATMKIEGTIIAVNAEYSEPGDDPMEVYRGMRRIKNTGDRNGTDLLRTETNLKGFSLIIKDAWISPTRLSKEEVAMLQGTPLKWKG